MDVHPCYHVITVKQTTEKKEGANQMNMSEAARVILGLRSVGWDEKAINDFILWVETGDEQYQPKEK